MSSFGGNEGGRDEYGWSEGARSDNGRSESGRSNNENESPDLKEPAVGDAGGGNFTDACEEMEAVFA
jgi:hypothetical protein